MKNIYQDKIAIEKEKAEIEKNLNQIEILRKTLENENDNTIKHRQELIENAKIEARNMILSAKNEVNEIIRQINNLEKKYKNGLNHNALKDANQIRNNLNQKLQSIDNSKHNTLNLDVLKSLNSKESMRKNTLNNKQNMKTTSSVNFTKNNYKSQNISSEINVIGLNVDEAIFLIDKYIDDCVISKLSPIRIVHGKGTGKLRQGIHKFLKTNHFVKSYRLGTFGEGEMGVTVVELK